LIVDWIKKHQNAVVIPVSSFGPIEMKVPSSRFIYCWVIDGSDTLNNYLVIKGCFPGGTMRHPETFWELSMSEKWSYIKENPHIRVYISKKKFKIFLNQIIAAEKFARSNKLGIWKNI
jgi:hypothetical protein